MDRSKVQTALNKVTKAFQELQHAVGDGNLFYLTTIGILDKDGKDPGLSTSYANVDKKKAIFLAEAQLDSLKDQDTRKATREEYEQEKAIAMTPQEAREILLSGETKLYIQVEEAMRFEINALLLERNETVAEAKEPIREYLRGWCGILPDQQYSWHGAMITNAVDVVAHMIAMELGIDLPDCSHTVNP